MAMTGDLDLEGAEMLSELHKELHDMGIRLRLSRVQQSARTLLDRMGITEQIGKENIHDRTLFAVAHYLTEEGVAKRAACDILPDMVRCVQEMVGERAGHVGGEERDRLDIIRGQLDAILKELEELPCEVP
jgi:MFS superfamily sulfate permease-like transporter